MQKLNLVYHTDPGHGWLAVPMDMVRQLGLVDKISDYSYQTPGGQALAYLEEDCDAPLLLEALKAAGHEYHISTVRTDRGSPIRGYPSFTD
jgi:hypothetical protein